MSLAAAGGAGGSVGPAIHKHYTSLQMQRNASVDEFYTREVVPGPQLSPKYIVEYGVGRQYLGLISQSRLISRLISRSDLRRVKPPLPLCIPFVVFQAFRRRDSVQVPVES